MQDSSVSIWPSSEMLLSKPMLKILADIASPIVEDVFEMASEVEPETTEYKGITFYDSQPFIDGEYTVENTQALVHFLRPTAVSKWMQAITLSVFWFTMMFWDMLTYLMIGDGSIPKSYSGSRRSNRMYHRLSRRTMLGPLFIFLPIGWMVMSHAIQVSHD